jgi:hypothetical protein
MDYVGVVLDRLEQLCDDYLIKSQKLATSDHAILREQLENARKKLRGTDGASIVMPSPWPRVPLVEKNTAVAASVKSGLVMGENERDIMRSLNASSFVSKACDIAETYTFKDLQRELKARGLRASGKKQELKDRLKVALAQELAEAAMDAGDFDSVVSPVVVSEPIVSLAAVEVSLIADQGPASVPVASEAITEPAMFSSHIGKELPFKKDASQSPLRTSTHRVQPDCLADFRARQIEEQKTKQEVQLACERERKERVLTGNKCKEAEDSARRTAAIKRCDEVGEVQHEAKLRHGDSSAVADTALGAISPKPSHKAAPTKVALEPKRLTPGLNEYKQAAKPKQEPKHFSPIDTYEISDREESTDDEEDNEERQRKHMPAWASGINLREALRAQANSDPSAVFAVGASSCDLKNIFKTDRVFKKRTSSQNWGMDLSTQMERQRYCTEMGFAPPN